MAFILATTAGTLPASQVAKRLAMLSADGKSIAV